MKLYTRIFRIALRSTFIFGFAILVGSALISVLTAQVPARVATPDSERRVDVQMAAAQNSLGPGEPAWLAYRPVRSAVVFPGGVPDTVVALGHGELENSAVRELALGWRGMLGREPRVVASGDDAKQAVVIGTQAEIKAWRPQAKGAASNCSRRKRTGCIASGQHAGGGGW